jgi:hypothetical protein
VSEAHPAALAAAAASGQAVVRAVTLEELLRRPHVHYALLAAGEAQAAAAAAAAKAEAEAGTAGEEAAGDEQWREEQERQQEEQQQEQQRRRPLTAAEAEAVEIDIKYAGRKGSLLVVRMWFWAGQIR